jgi:hypothetical protein
MKVRMVRVKSMLIFLAHQTIAMLGVGVLAAECGPTGLPTRHVLTTVASMDLRWHIEVYEVAIRIAEVY